MLQGVCRNRKDREEVGCPDCGKLLPTRRHLQEHRRTKHRTAATPTAAPFPPALQNMGHSIGQYFSTYPPHQPTARAGSNPCLPMKQEHLQLQQQPEAVVAVTLPHIPQHQQQQEPQQHTMIQGRCDPCPLTTTTTGYPNQAESSQQHFYNHSYGLPTAHHHNNTTTDVLAASVAAAGLPGATLPADMAALPPLEPLEENVGSLLRQVYSTEHSDYGSAACRAGGQPTEMSFVSFLFDYC